MVTNIFEGDALSAKQITIIGGNCAISRFFGQGFPDVAIVVVVGDGDELPAFLSPNLFQDIYTRHNVISSYSTSRTIPAQFMIVIMRK